MKYEVSLVRSEWIKTTVEAGQDADESQLLNLAIEAIEDGDYYIKDTDYNDFSVDNWEETDEEEF